MDQAHGPRKNRTVALFGTYLLVGLLSLEVGVRSLLYVEWRRQIGNTHGLHIPDTVLGYRLAPGRTAWGAKINSLGYRGEEFAPDKTEGTFRIICVGNSITFGEAASSESTTYPALLQQYIMNRGEIGTSVQVINAGVMGYTSYQCLMELKTRVIGLHPDLVIFSAGWNDMTFSKYIEWTPTMTWEAPWHFLTLKGSYAIWLLNERVLHFPVSVKPLPLNTFSNNLDSVATFCRQKKVGLAFLDPPTMFSESMTPSEVKKCRINYFVQGEIPMYTAYRSAMEEVALKKNITVLDSGLTYSVSGKDSLIVDVCHPNDDGYRHMVRVLYPQVVREIWHVLKERGTRIEFDPRPEARIRGCRAPTAVAHATPPEYLKHSHRRPPWAEQLKSGFIGESHSSKPGRNPSDHLL